MINVEKIKPTGLFTNYIYKAIPLAFDESMSYYETLCGLLSYLKNTVVPTVNNNADAIIELQNYVDNYFNNLDVQEEINNKLDEMVINGTLDKIIGNYINYKMLRCYNNIDELKQEILEPLTKVKTLGYHKINDNGGAFYYISNNIVDNERCELLNDGKYAVLINDGYVTPEMFGAKGDGINDDIISLNLCRDYCIQKNILMRSSSNKIYGISTGFDILTGCNIDFGNATFKALNSMDYVIRQHKTLDSYNVPVYSEYTKNIIIDCDNKADYGFYQDVLGWSVLTDNIRVISPKNIGVYIKLGQIRMHNVKIEQEFDINCIGLQVDSSDSEYYNIVTRDCSTGIKINGSSNGFYECHPVMFKTGLLPNSKGIDINAYNIIVHPILDTFQYGIYARHQGGFDVIAPQLVTNTTYYNNETMEINPILLYFVQGNNAVNRVNVSSAELGNYKILNNEYATFTNVTLWNSGKLLLDNPSIAFGINNFKGIPKEVSQINSVNNLETYLQNGYTATNIQATNNGNTIEYRITKLNLPNIAKDAVGVILNNMPTSLVPTNNKVTNSITKNGIIVAISTINTGALTITPLSGEITEGDYIYFTSSFIK